MSYRVWSLSAVVALSLSSVGCGDAHDHDDDDHDHDHGGVEDEGCDHMEGGPNVAITAAAAASATTIPDGTAGHIRIDVTLVGDGDAKGGVVRYTADEAGDFYLFLSKDVPVTITDPGAGLSVAAEATHGPVDACPTIITKHYGFELEAKPYLITFGPTSEASVSYVIEAAHGDHAHD